MTNPPQEKETLPPACQSPKGGVLGVVRAKEEHFLAVYARRTGTQVLPLACANICRKYRDTRLLITSQVHKCYLARTRRALRLGLFVCGAFLRPRKHPHAKTPRREVARTQLRPLRVRPRGLHLRVAIRLGAAAARRILLAESSESISSDT